VGPGVGFKATAGVGFKAWDQEASSIRHGEEFMSDEDGMSTS